LIGAAQAQAIIDAVGKLESESDMANIAALVTKA
jgi:hypothetical protein